MRISAQSTSVHHGVFLRNRIEMICIWPPKYLMGLQFRKAGLELCCGDYHLFWHCLLCWVKRVVIFRPDAGISEAVRALGTILGASLQHCVCTQLSLGHIQVSKAAGVFENL